MNFPADDLLLDPADPGCRAFLANVQANILKCHGRDHGRLLMFRSTVRPLERSPLFWREVAERITSAAEQERQARNRAAEPDTVLRTFAISAAGMAALDVDDLPARSGRAEEGKALVSENDPSDRFGPFNLGMRESFRLSGVPMNHELVHWEDAYSRQVHVLWFLACACEEKLESECERLIAWSARQGLQVVATEKTRAWRNAEGGAREPFGFVDGISVATFFAKDAARGCASGPWARMKLSDVLIHPRLSRRHQGGSMLVVRKLEQNVRAFHEFTRQMEPVLQGAGMGDEPVSSLLVGRRANGDPLPAIARREHAGVDPRNDFDFDDDGRGEACPFHAHIRKMNPRMDRLPDGNSARVGDQLRSVQLVRRGMPYDPLGALAARERGEVADWPEQSVGLMFMAFANTLEPFETMQNNWAHHPRFPQPSGSDPILAGENAPWRWKGVCSPAPLARFVTARGGEYFYVPSLERIRYW